MSVAFLPISSNNLSKPCWSPPSMASNNWLSFCFVEVLIWDLIFSNSLGSSYLLKISGSYFAVNFASAPVTALVSLPTLLKVSAALVNRVSWWIPGLGSFAVSGLTRCAMFPITCAPSMSLDVIWTILVKLQDALGLRLNDLPKFDDAPLVDNVRVVGLCTLESWFAV